MNPLMWPILARATGALASAIAAHRTDDHVIAPDLAEPAAPVDLTRPTSMPKHLRPVPMPTAGTHCMRGEICARRHDLRGEHLVMAQAATTAPYAASPWASFEGITR